MFLIGINILAMVLDLIHVEKNFETNFFWVCLIMGWIVNGVETYKFKQKHSEINAALLCLVNILTDFVDDNL